MTILDVDFAGRRFRFFEAGPLDRSVRELQAGTFEEPLPLVVMGMVARLGGTFVDVGANSGIYSILAAKTREDVKVHAFEPLPLCLETLKRNVILNEVSDRVSIHELALSDSSGTATMYIPDSSHGLLETSASLEADFKPAASTTLVPRTTLDEFGLQDQISVIKVDIEGHEPAFLRGATRTISKERPVIFCEILHMADTKYLSEFSVRKDYIPFRLRSGLAIHTPRIRFDARAWNWCLVPKEKLTTFEDMCIAHALEIVKSTTINY